MVEIDGILPERRRKRKAFPLHKALTLRYDEGEPAHAVFEGFRLNLGGGHERMEQPFRVLEHTADVGFEACGGTLEEVFRNAARALVNLTLDLDSIRPVRTTSIQVEGSDLKELLVNWLSEILYLQDTENLYSRDFEIKHLSENSVKALARGELLDAGRHSVKMQVKAVTYHELALEQIAGGWRAQVYVDI
jgi:SHS2 domain-containing protein